MHKKKKEIKPSYFLKMKKDGMKLSVLFFIYINSLFFDTTFSSFNPSNLHSIFSLKNSQFMSI